jgi:predicted nucleotidyltransferase
MLDIDRVKPLLNRWARSHYPYLCALVVFGSYAQDKATESSDLDLAAIVKANPCRLPGERLSDEATNYERWTQELKALPQV